MIPGPDELARDLLGTNGDVPFEPEHLGWSPAEERRFHRLVARCCECGTWCRTTHLSGDEPDLACRECA